MPELLTMPLVFGEGIAFVGLSPGAVYSMKPGSGGTGKVMTGLSAAAAVFQITHITIESEENGE